MKKVLTLVAAVALSATAIAQNWKIDGSHTKIRFTTKYLVISDVDGEFKKFDGTFTSSSGSAEGDPGVL